MIGRKNIFRAPPQKLIRRRGKKPLDGGTHHDRTAIDGKQQQAIVESAENLVDVFAQIAENFPDAAELHSDLADLRADLAEFVSALERLLIEFAFGDAVELRGNALERRQRKAAYERGKQNGNSHRDQRQAAPPNATRA